MGTLQHQTIQTKCIWEDIITALAELATINELHWFSRRVHNLHTNTGTHTLALEHVKHTEVAIDADGAQTNGSTATTD